MHITQRQFRKALMDPHSPAPEGLNDGRGNPASRRFDVYRNNVIVALMEALRTAFPVLRKLLGTQNFDHLARLFARAHPPQTPLMMHYGAAMPAFLENFASLSHIAYLPDVARLELAMRQSYHAADTPALDPAELATVSPDILMASTLTLAAPVALIRSTWPIVDIWRFNTLKGAPEPRGIGQSALIMRTGFDPEPHALDAAQTAWVTSIVAAKTLADAQGGACAIDPDFDLTPLLSLLIQHDAIAEFTRPKEKIP